MSNVYQTVVGMDKSFAAGLENFVNAAMENYNSWTYKLLFDYRDEITGKQQHDTFEWILRNLEFQDKTDGFPFMTYLHDSGIDVTGYLDNLTFYTMLLYNANSRRMSPEDVMRKIDALGRSEKRFQFSCIKPCLTNATIYKKNHLLKVEFKMHMLSEVFQTFAIQWLQTYDVDYIRRRKLPNNMLMYTDQMFFMECSFRVGGNNSR